VSAHEDVAVIPERYDVVIVGAGIAGLNALVVASTYLSRTDRVLLVDRRDRVGGMWVDTYPYVRLHQPHPFFTAGDIPWTLGEDRAYLATKHEVLDHFAHCLDVVRGRVQLDLWFGTEYVDHEVVEGLIRVSCRNAGGGRRVAMASRFVKATSLEIKANDPYPVSSSRVNSVTPEGDVREGEIARSDAPVWILGGGKTGMDTARTMIVRYPGREINMLAGSGTFFINRDRAFPTGRRRWWGGQRGYPVFRDWAMRFDGSNQHDVMSWIRSRSGTCLSVTPQANHFLFGQMSPSEASTIRAGLTHVVMDHLLDAVDSNGEVEMQLRSGATRRIQPGSWVVNCTGHFFRGQPLPYTPYVSGDGRVAAISPRSGVALLSSFAGYFTSHLLMLDKLADLPLYELDSETLGRADRDAWACALVAVHMHNLAVMFDEVPRAVFAGNGLDFERWFPVPRQMLTSVQFAREHRQVREHTEAALDRVREVHGVRCGPLSVPAPSALDRGSPPPVPPGTPGGSSARPRTIRPARSHR
jgi:hypothetical protein